MKTKFVRQTHSGDSVIEVFPVGSQVRVNGDVSARVTAVVIRENSIAYEIIWWSGEQRKLECVESWEVLPDSDKTNALRVSPIL
jgi:hypothetical protein